MPLDLDFEPVPPNSDNPEVAFNSIVAKLKAAILELEAGGGGTSLPALGSAGQFLKIGADGTTLEWGAGGGSGGITLPPGGTPGQVLKLASDGVSLVWGNDLQGSGGGADPAGPFRYYRHTMDPAVSGAAMAFGELKSFVAGPTLQVPTAMSASSSYVDNPGSYGPLKLIDGSTGTFWHQNNSTPGEWIITDFGGPLSIVRFQYVIADGRAGQRPGIVTIEGADVITGPWTTILEDQTLEYNALTTGGTATLNR